MLQQDLALTDPLSSIPEDEYTKLLHFTVWPCAKFDHFKAMLERKPEEIHIKFGVQQETLLHR